MTWNHLSPVIAGVLGLLILFSVGSWTILILKLWQIRTVRRVNKDFMAFFWETKEFDRIEAGLTTYSGPLATVFQEGYRETRHFLEQQPTTGVPRLSTDLNVMENVARSLRKVSGQEVERLEKNLSFLATTASTTPFIGLFGTVWGIMNAFQNIGNAGSTSLSIVAPGISEALVTTAIGLAVAIPAVIGFNYLQSKIRRQVAEIDNFTYDFLNIVQKLFQVTR